MTFFQDYGEETEQPASTAGASARCSKMQHQHTVTPLPDFKRPYTEELSSQGLAPQERPLFSFLINVSAKRVGTLIKIG